ncbi:MAG TPA: efflux RND transporter permease subunit [Polyangia bacterium]|jgi:Cu(I)/Ag(I) efflux system membrane protein CusA/SilA
MISRLVAWSARHHWAVIIAGLVLAIAGDLARRGLARDVVPDLADPQIAVVADWMGHPAPEVATAVAKPLTDALAGVPGSKAIRASTMTGMAYVDVVFASADGLDAAHRDIAARIERARAQLPPNVRIYLGSTASTTGWVFEYALTDRAHVSSAYEMRRFQEEVLKPALVAIPGVAEVASVGGDLHQVRIDIRPRELRARGLAFTDVLAALQPVFQASVPGAASGVARISIADLEATPISPPGASPNGGPIRVRDVALVREVEDMQTGLADLAGVRAVGGIVIAKRDANITALTDEVKRTIAREARKLPHRPADSGRLDSGAAADVHVSTAYDRSDLAGRVKKTLLRALGEEVGVVVLIILLFLLHARSALVPLATLPVVLLLTFGAMWALGVPATIMSLGGIGIALGMAVDADIVALEASHRRLETLDPAAPPADRRAKLLAAAQSYAPAILTALVITALSFLPVFAFTGETGRLLRPLALTKTLVVVSAAVVTLTLAPALRDRLLRGRVIPEFENPLTRNLVRLYRPFVRFALNRPTLTLATAGLALVSCLPIVTRLGGEFLPRVDEGDLLYMPTTQPGVPAEQAALQLFWQDFAMSQFDEVGTVFGKVGRADTGTDPAPYSMAETTIRLRPRDEWPKIPRRRWYSSWAPGWLQRVLRPLWPDATPRTNRELIEALDKTASLPGWRSAWTAPARARMDMMATGVRTPVGVRVISPDPKRLEEIGVAVRDVVSGLPGTRSAVFEGTGGETWLSFDADPPALARFDVDPGSVRRVVDLFSTGGQLGEIQDPQGRLLRVRISPDVPDLRPRGPADQLRELTIRSGATAAAGTTGQPVPLALLGHPAYERRPAALRTEHGDLCAYVYVDLEDGADVQRFVERARRDVDAAVAAGQVRLGPGERIEWTGQYGLLIAGQQRLAWIVPLVLLSMLGLLLWQFRSLTEALLVLASVPFALVGSFWTLYLLGYPLSAPVWVGLLSVVGLAMQTGVVMVVYIDEAFYRRVREGRLRSREDIVAAHAEGTVQRLRPKIMTITTMAVSLLPLLRADGAGSEIMRRVAAPMLGGLVTSAFLTLEVLPVLYTIWRHRQLRRALALGVPIASVVGPARVGLPTNGHGGRPGDGAAGGVPAPSLDNRQAAPRPQAGA